MSIFSYHLFLATNKNRQKLPPQLLIEKDLHTTRVNEWDSRSRYNSFQRAFISHDVIATNTLAATTHRNTESWLNTFVVQQAFWKTKSIMTKKYHVVVRKRVKCTDI